MDIQNAIRRVDNILTIFGFKSKLIKIISMLKLIPKISLATRKLLTFGGTYGIHHDGTQMPRQFSFYYPPQQKKLLNNKKNRVISQQLKQYHDTLVLPGYNEQNISELYMEYRRKKVILSSQNVAMLIHMFTKYNIMTSEMFDLIEKQAFKLKGQYKSRSIFGALRGSIIYHRQNMIDFFIQQFRATDQKLTMHQMLQILQAINSNRLMSKAAKNKLWEEFKPDFLDGLMTLKIKDVDFISRVFDGLRKIKEKDEKIWERVIKMMKYKKGWNMIPVFQRLYQISGQYESAKKQFDHYFQKMSNDVKIMERYNLTEVRYRTPLQIIKHVEQNPTDYQPKLRTLIPEKYDPNEWNKKYEEFLKVGSIKQEQQIIKDKSKSLGFAIKERYQSLTADGIDFSKLDKQQFNQMFGDYNTVVETINEAKTMLEKQEKDLQENPHLYENQEQEQQQEKQNKKGKGKGKQEAKDKGDNNEKQEKNKKQKGDKQQKKQKGKKKKQQ